MTTQSGHASGRTRSPNQVPEPRISRTVAMLARASAKPRAWPTPSETAVPSPCLLEQISQRLMIRQFTMISGT